VRGLTEQTPTAPVSLAQVAGGRGHRHQLEDQVLDPGLVLAGRPPRPTRLALMIE